MWKHRIVFLVLALLGFYVMDAPWFNLTHSSEQIELLRLISSRPPSGNSIFSPWLSYIGNGYYTLILLINTSLKY